MSIIFMLYLSIYQHPTDNTKSIIECAYDTRNPDRLIVKNSDLNSLAIDEWVVKVCHE